MDFIITEKKATLCLNMIVKNESHIIECTLEKLCNKIHFDYWVICDTGSTDNTQKIIQNFFEKKGIKGELFQDEWVDFAHNRTLALKRAYKKTNLLLIFDADDEIEGDINIPLDCLFDEYQFKFGSSSGTSYVRTLMINNYKQFEFLSVIHEFITCKEGPTNQCIINGDYYVVSGRTGNRSLDPDKYLKDALILEKAHALAVKNNDHLFHRYAFYCANSYKDCNRIEDAIKWYQITLSQEKQWPQESYVSCLYLFDCFQKLNQSEKGFFYLVQSFKYDTERVECLYPLLVHYCCNNMNRVAYNYYLNVKDFYENRYLHTDISSKLFTIPDRYTFYVPYYMILIADKVQDFKCVLKMYEILFTKKPTIFIEWYVKHFLFNLQFFLQHVPKENTEFIPLANNYIKFVYQNGFNLQQFDFLSNPVYKNAGIIFDDYIIKKVTSKPQSFSKEECSRSKNILIYTGFSNIDWNYSYMQNNALGGSEKAIIYISQCFPKEYTIFISGGVKCETVGNIQYIHLNELTNLIISIPFHTLIVSRYISFYEMFKECSFYQSFIWAHDVSLLPYGCSLNETSILKKWDNYINGCICLTEWHKKEFVNKYPHLKNKISLINNGIDINSFPNIETNKKIKNKFIYSSRPDRGLNKLLQLWPHILEKMPGATLTIASYIDLPFNSSNEPNIKNIKNIIDNHNSIQYLGKLNTEQLYNEMASSEYWLYPTHWAETSCITALEMLMSEVICLYYPVAGLVDTMDKFGLQVQTGKEIDTIVSLTEEQKQLLRKNGREYVEQCSWENRFKKWNELLNIKEGKVHSFYNYEHNFIKLINLERRKDRLNKMIEQFKRSNIEHYDIIKAIDGQILQPTSYIKNLFKGNNFNYIKGVIGCALSHYNLWKQLLDDENNNYYCIFEDDINLVDNFKEKLEKVISNFYGNFCLLGGPEIKVPNINISKLNILNRSEKIIDCLFGYIISKNGAKLLIDYINFNYIHVPIDHIYVFAFENINIVNEYLVKSITWQLDGNTDTDIQLDKNCLNFNNPIKISYTDWWVTEYCGGTFNYEHNFFTDLLSEYYNIEVVKPEENPDILFYSVFGNNYKNLTTKRKIFYSGESISQRDDADFNITFDNNSDKNCRCPLWLCYLNDELIKDNKKKLLGFFNIPKKSKFCSIICQIDNKTGERSSIIDKLFKYKRVDCGGTFMNNIGYIVPRGINCSGKIEHNNEYKFCIAFENANYPGYVTEKICDAYKSKCIPIYWGTRDVIKDFNPNTFINANDFTNFDELVKYIIKVDTDDELYESYFKEPIFSKYWLDIIYDNNKSFYKNLANNIVENTNQDIQYFSQNKQDEFLEKYIFKSYKNGFFMDVGAHDGIKINNTIYFEKYNNWNGINIEPLDDVYKNLIINRPNSVNLNVAIDNKDGTCEFICNSGYTEMLSGIKSSYHDEHFKRLNNELIRFGGESIIKIVNTNTLKTVCNKHKINHINYLSIDVEGNEFNVLNSIDFNNLFIDVIGFEDNYADTTKINIEFLEKNNFIYVGRFGDIIMIHKKSKFIKNININQITNFDCWNLQINHNLENELKNASQIYNKIIGFHSNQLCERGTEVAMFDYAYYNQKLYGNKSIIFYCKHSNYNDNNIICKFEKEFKCYAYNNFSDINKIILDEKIDYFYNIKSGTKDDNQIVTKCPNLIHAVFTVDPHGDKYATISKYLSNKYNNVVDYIPHMINLPNCNENMRDKLHIPNNTIVFGRYGGFYQFDIEIAHNAIKKMLELDSNLFFLFVNTNKFYEHPRIVYLDKITDPIEKVKFINSCDVMIHARSDGETFGLAIAEFSSLNKPIITCASNTDNAHIEMLGSKGIIYDTEDSLMEIFKNIRTIINSNDDWNAYKEYTPENVMQKFMGVFINKSVKEKKLNYTRIEYIDINNEVTSLKQNKKELVIVTAFLDIKRENWNIFKRTPSQYIQSFTNYFNYSNKMIIFIDDKYFAEIKELYEKSSHNNSILIPINKQWMTENIYAWQQLDISTNIMNSEYYKNLVNIRIKHEYPENIYPQYNAINNSKIDFIYYAINNKLINEDDFICWSDFGYFNSILHKNPNKYPLFSIDVQNFETNKLSFCLRNKLDVHDEDIIYTLLNAPEKFTGSFFAGPCNLMVKLQKLYHQSLNELHNNDISDDDQHIYLRCFLKEPDLFNLYLDSTRWPEGLNYFQKSDSKNIDDIINLLLKNMHQSSKTELCDVMNKYGSDKGNGWHNYTKLYYKIFKDKRNDELNIFELGLGTNNINIPSNMGVFGKPCASLYGWKEFFKNSKIFGADIDKDILIYTEDIKTYYCHQLSKEIINNMYNNSDLQNTYFDIIIEDGLHTFEANMSFMCNSLHKLKPDGIYIVENIHRSYKDRFTYELLQELTNKYNLKYIKLVELPNQNNSYDNTLLIIQKNNTIHNNIIYKNISNNDYRPLFLVTSLINLKRLTIYSSDERLLQTKNTIKSIYNYCPNATVVILEASDYKYNNEDIEQYKNLYIYYVKINVIEMHKSIGECQIIKEFVHSQLYESLINENKINIVFKLSGRYWLNDDFKITNFNLDKHNFRNTNPLNDDNVIDKPNNDTNMYSITCLFTFNPNSINEIIDSLDYSIENITKNGSDVEHNIYSFFYNKSLCNSIDNLGVSGFISPTGQLIKY